MCIVSCTLILARETRWQCRPGGLLPITQKALIVSPFLAYHDYEGVALETGERERLVEDLGDGNAMLLRNHGLLTVGESVGETFVWMHRLETACRYQVDGLAGERP